jgi:hypothetical protein
MNGGDDSLTVSEGVRVARDEEGLSITDGENTIHVPTRAAEPLADALRLLADTPIDDLPDGLAALVGDDPPAEREREGDICPECGAATIDGLGGRDCPSCGWSGDADATE